MSVSPFAGRMIITFTRSARMRAASVAPASAPGFHRLPSARTLGSLSVNTYSLRIRDLSLDGIVKLAKTFAQ